MEVKWHRYEIYEDGSQSCCSYGDITLGHERYEVTIIDHTRLHQKEDDEKYHRQVTHAYEVSGLPFYIGYECFYALGFENYPSLSSVRIDKNPGYQSKGCCCYTGPAPEHTIEEVEHLVEEAFVKAFTFDYNEELAKLKAQLDNRKQLMTEALSYKASRDARLNSGEQA